MKRIQPDGELAELLEEFDRIGGVVDYLFLHEDGADMPEVFHRRAALAAICFFMSGSIHGGEEPANFEGRPISLEEFWGTDVVEPTQIAHNAWSTPEVDGYKTAFFLPPHRLSGGREQTRRLFERINPYVLGSDRTNAEIFCWSTDWSAYFDAGREWWGTFLWTIRPGRGRDFVAVGASASD